MAAPTEDQAQQDDAAKSPVNNQASEAPSPHKASQLPQDTSPDTASALVEHPVYFIGTVLRDARARYPMPQKLLLAFLVASRKL